MSSPLPMCTSPCGAQRWGDGQTHVKRPRGEAAVCTSAACPRQLHARPSNPRPRPGERAGRQEAKRNQGWHPPAPCGPGTAASALCNSRTTARAGCPPAWQEQGWAGWARCGGGVGEEAWGTSSLPRIGAQNTAIGQSRTRDLALGRAAFPLTMTMGAATRVPGLTARCLCPLR